PLGSRGLSATGNPAAARRFDLPNLVRDVLANAAKERRKTMRHSLRSLAAFLAVSLFVLPQLSRAAAPDDTKGNTRGKPEAPVAAKAEQQVDERNLLEAMRDGLVAVKAEGIGDGRMTLSVTNKTSRPLRVVLPPGIVAQGATGQMGGMGGMG